MDEENDDKNDPTIEGQKFCNFGKDYAQDSADSKQCQGQSSTHKHVDWNGKEFTSKIIVQ